MLGYIYLLVAAAFGYMVVSHLVPQRASIAGDFSRLSLGVGVGFGTGSVLFFLLILAGVTPHNAAWSTGAVLVAGTVLMAAIPPPRRPLMPVHVERPVDRPLKRFMRLILLISLLINLVVFVNQVWNQPHGGLEALEVWNLRARFLAMGGPEHWRDAFSPALPHAHTDYPLLLPATVAAAWLTGGSLTPGIPIAVAAAFAFSTVIMIIATLTSLGRSTSAGLAALSVLSTPLFVQIAATQTADIPLIFFLSGTICAFYIGFATRSTSPFFLAGLMASFAAWTKNEGILWLLSSFFSFLIWSYASDHRMVNRRIETFCVAAAPVVIAVVLFKLTLAGPSDVLGGQTVNELFSKLVDPSRHQQVIQALIPILPNYGQWLVNPFLPVIVFIVLTFPRVYRASIATAGIAFLSSAVLLSGYYLLFVVTPVDLQQHVSSAADRLLLHATAVLFLAFSLLAISTRVSELYSEA